MRSEVQSIIFVWLIFKRALCYILKVEPQLLAQIWLDMACSNIITHLALSSLIFSGFLRIQAAGDIIRMRSFWSLLSLLLLSKPRRRKFFQPWLRFCIDSRFIKIFRWRCTGLWGLELVRFLLRYIHSGTLSIWSVGVHRILLGLIRFQFNRFLPSLLECLHGLYVWGSTILKMLAAFQP